MKTGGVLGANVRVSDFVGLWQSLRICISNDVTGDAYAAGPGTTLGEPLAQYQ